jgi:hypothetical protein
MKSLVTFAAISAFAIGKAGPENGHVDNYG